MSVTAGTIFHRTRTPLTVWLTVAWYMTSSKSGVSALNLHRLMGFGSYQSAWAMLHRFRTAMVRPGRDRLNGVVELDDAFFGGVKKGKPGRSAGGKAIVEVAVERLEPTGFGRCRLGVIDDLRSATIAAFLRDSVEPGSRVLTDSSNSYPSALGSDYEHRYFHAAYEKSKGRADQLLPGVNRVVSLAKRWLLGTHQGAVHRAHLQAYLDEFAFRFNRRRSEFRGLLFRRLLEQSVQVGPTSYRSLVANPTAKRIPPGPPGGAPARARAVADASATPARPWRNHNI